MMLSLREALNNLLGLLTTDRVIISSKILEAASDYDAEDVMSETSTDTKGTAWVFDLTKESGVIEKAIALCSTTALTPRLTLYLFSENPNCEKDDDAANTAPLAAEAPAYVGAIDFPAMEDLGTGMSNAIATPGTYGNLPLPYVSPDKKLHGVLVTRDAITGEAANMRMTIQLQVKEG